jgi:ABC-type branched-subunit amino acid transport system permease subunit
MLFKILGSILAASLLIVFIGPVAIKLKDVAFSIVVLIGLTMMIADIWQALKSKED